MVVGQRTRGQAPPPHIVFAALTDPTASTGRREWLFLAADEAVPRVLAADPPARVVWSSLWPDRPDLRIEFAVEPDLGGTRLTWTLWSPEPGPDASAVGHLRTRLNELINRDLRHAFGQ